MIDFRKPWLNLPPGLAHELSHLYLKLLSKISSPNSLKRKNNNEFGWKPITWRNLNFANPLGTSGGIDKNAELIRAFWSLGAGFVEVGTVTPQPQAANAGTILLRDSQNLALWNKMGFPNLGLASIKKELSKFTKPHFTPIFVNIGKNRTTSNENAVNDYLQCIRELKSYADAFVVNISSPNTSGLRELLEPNKLQSLLKPLIAECDEKIPLLLKLSPDMSDVEINNVLQVTLLLKLDGWIITNTTLARDPSLNFPAEGGVSGKPLASRSKEILRLVSQYLKMNGDPNSKRLVISAGGVLTPQDVFERLQIGADLVQVYSALVFEGPHFFKKVAKTAKTT